ncbi:uncharacterized protein HMPREF1541_07154 [Cyphellophora europaea CBS 101466]|uniref:Uncharacterized protein n=1 Tax=Cyphellophora europaea (strain CBS 101466) TaxID=1220924 RepID=W2RM31_CYPE1|nr:uncharacterized protein HMPREF1541_07154 [Cyphellophora europaea CBS 101466]ETN37532.1 hypothetical protein HMPREF1541_07154 [Cyphellophora europaea CBS 101466]
MFQWYENAAVCYAYLADVEELHPPLREPENSSATIKIEAEIEAELTNSDWKQFQDSRWHRRG